MWVLQVQGMQSICNILMVSYPISEVGNKALPERERHLIDTFVSDRRLRGLRPRTCQLYEDYLTRKTYVHVFLVVQPEPTERVASAWF